MDDFMVNYNEWTIDDFRKNYHQLQELYKQLHQEYIRVQAERDALELRLQQSGVAEMPQDEEVPSSPPPLQSNIESEDSIKSFLRGV